MGSSFEQSDDGVAPYYGTDKSTTPSGTYEDNEISENSLGSESLNANHLAKIDGLMKPLVEASDILDLRLLPKDVAINTIRQRLVNIVGHDHGFDEDDFSGAYNFHFHRKDRPGEEVRPILDTIATMKSECNEQEKELQDVALKFLKLNPKQARRYVFRSMQKHIFEKAGYKFPDGDAKSIGNSNSYNIGIPMLEDAHTLLDEYLYSLKGGELLGVVNNGSNKNEVLVKDFVPFALTSLMINQQPGLEVVRQTLQGEFGNPATQPIDCGLWWIILLRSYSNVAPDGASLIGQLEVQNRVVGILDLCMKPGYNRLPAILCADTGNSMGRAGYPIETQAVFHFALSCALKILNRNLFPTHFDRTNQLETELKEHIRNNYWLDAKLVRTADTNSVPQWFPKFILSRGGYFAGNFIPPQRDFRCFLVGSLIAILSNLATREQSDAIINLVEDRWTDLIAEIPLKTVYPPLEKDRWGNDMRKKKWKYDNGGSWPALLWLLTAACLKAKRPWIARKAIEAVEKRMSEDVWPEYYDGEAGQYVGKQAREKWRGTICGYVAAKILMKDSSKLGIISLEDDREMV